MLSKSFIYQLMHNRVALKEYWLVGWLVWWCGCRHTTEPTTTMYFNWLF